MPATNEHAKERWPLIVIGLLTVLGFALRLHQYDTSLLGDELSTLWIVENHGLFDTIDIVSGDAEITPPLYFVLAWFAAKLGTAPELIRLPALIAGTASIPMVYLLGLRTTGRIPGLFAAALMALSPFMIFFAGSGRVYTVMIALLIGSCLAMLAAIRTGRTGWWVAYAALTALAAYAHYTALFVLAAQFLWLLWAEPGARRAGLIASAGAAVLFLPWLPGLRADLDAPTRLLLEALQGDGLSVKIDALAQWAVGHPLLTPGQLPGRFAIVLIAGGLLVAAVAAVVRLVRENVPLRPLREHRFVVLVFALALATPVIEGVLALGGSDMFGSRNLTASWPGLALAAGTVLAAPGMLWGGLCGLAVIGGFTIGTVKTLGSDAATIDYSAAAERINEEAAPGATVVDLLSAPITPAPATPLGAYLRPDLKRYSLNLPAGDPPFLPLTPVPDPDELLDEALTGAGGEAVYLVGPRLDAIPGDSRKGRYEAGDIVLPRGWRVDSVERYPGVAELDLVRITREPTR